MFMFFLGAFFFFFLLRTRVIRDENGFSSRGAVGNGIEVMTEKKKKL